jgi:hypothetical protein
MQRYRKVIVFAGVVIIAVVSTVLITGIYTNFEDPELHRNFLRFLTIVGIAALCSMGGSVLLRTESIDKLASIPANEKPRR